MLCFDYNCFIFRFLFYQTFPNHQPTKSVYFPPQSPQTFSLFAKLFRLFFSTLTNTPIFLFYPHNKHFLLFSALPRYKPLKNLLPHKSHIKKSRILTSGFSNSAKSNNFFNSTQKINYLERVFLKFSIDFWASSKAF